MGRPPRAATGYGEPVGGWALPATPRATRVRRDQRGRILPAFPFLPGRTGLPRGEPPSVHQSTQPARPFTAGASPPPGPSPARRMGERPGPRAPLPAHLAWREAFIAAALARRA